MPVALTPRAIAEKFAGPDEVWRERADRPFHPKHGRHRGHHAQSDEHDRWDDHAEALIHLHMALFEEKLVEIKLIPGGGLQTCRGRPI